MYLVSGGSNIRILTKDFRENALYSTLVYASLEWSIAIEEVLYRHTFGVGMPWQNLEVEAEVDVWQKGVVRVLAH